MAPAHGLTALLFAVLATAASAQVTNTRLFVDTALGRVQGAACPGSSSTFRWLGIPYAQAPVGALRWAPPVAYNTRFPSPQFDATRPGPWCPQDTVRGLGASSATAFSEDCLSINVWAPLNISVPQPVRVFISGGSLSSSSGAWAAFDGCQVSYDAPVITVTFNYRLGVLGWLGANGLGTGSGNWGLLDTQLALQWVQTNIAAFGGDPKRVTLHGQSSGGSLVLANLVAPAAYNSDYTPKLFSQMILESPSLYLYNNVNDTYAQTAEFSAYANCTTGDLACLRALSADAVIAAQKRMALADFGPTVDGTILPQSPFELLAMGRSPRVPLLLTFSNDEGNLAAAQYLAAGASDLTQTAAQDLIMSVINPPVQYRYRILNAYTAEAFNGSWFAAASTAITEARYQSGAVRLLNAITSLGANAWAGLYTMPATNGCPYRMLGATAAQITAFGSRFGAAHGADLSTFFQHPLTGTSFPWGCSAADYTTAEKQLATFVGGAVASYMGGRAPVPITTRTTTSSALQAVTAAGWPRYRALFGTASGDAFLQLSVTQPTVFNYSAAAIARNQIWNDIRDWMDMHGRYGDYTSVQAFVQAQPQLSLMAQVLQASGNWVGLLSGSYTYFLPSNDAVSAYLNSTNMTAAQLLALPRSQLQNLITYHVYTRAIDVQKHMPPRQRVIMANGAPAYIMRTDTTVRVLDRNLNAGLVDPATASTLAGRSYVNIIDSVLSPTCS